MLDFLSIKMSKWVGLFFIVFFPFMAVKLKQPMSCLSLWWEQQLARSRFSVDALLLLLWLQLPSLLQLLSVAKEKLSKVIF